MIILNFIGEIQTRFTHIFSMKSAILLTEKKNVLNIKQFQ